VVLMELGHAPIVKMSTLRFDSHVTDARHPSRALKQPMELIHHQARMQHIHHRLPMLLIHHKVGREAEVEVDAQSLV